MTAGGPVDLQLMSRNRPIAGGSPSGDLAVTGRWSRSDRQLTRQIWAQVQKSVTLLPPVIPAVVTMLRRREFEQHLAHFNILMGVAAIVMEYEEEEERQRRKHAAQRRWWVRPWLARRPIYGHYEQLMNELLRENYNDFKNFLCVEPEMFFELVERAGPRIQKSTR